MVFLSNKVPLGLDRGSGGPAGEAGEAGEEAKERRSMRIEVSER